MVLRVGTDCSGIEAPIQALKKSKIPFKHVFSSDTNKHVIESIKANYNPEIIFGDSTGPFPNGDITERNLKDIPNIDLYICGFPCQTFSSAGSRKGFDDIRGIVFFSCLKVIKKKQPKYFILENVKGLLTHDKGNTFELMVDELKKLKRHGYCITWSVLNTKDYGIPQNRERVWIVGVKGEEFNFPKERKMPSLKKFVDWKDKHEDEMIDTLKKHIFKFQNTPSIYIDICFIKYSNFTTQDRYSSCLNTMGLLWNIPLHRYANINEYLMLQGFPLDFKQVVSNKQLKKQLGNSMSVNVLCEIFKCCNFNI